MKERLDEGSSSESEEEGHPSSKGQISHSEQSNSSDDSGDEISNSGSDSAASCNSDSNSKSEGSSNGDEEGKEAKSGSGSESNSGSDSSSGSESDSESGSTSADSGSNNEECTRDGSSLDTSRSSSKSKNSLSSSDHGADLKKFWEKNPDIYGIRRSGRERKQPDRINIDRKESKHVRKRVSGENSSELSLSEESDDQDGYVVRRNQLAKKPLNKKLVKSRGDLEDKFTRRQNMRTTGRGAGVSYKEVSDTDETEDEDILDVDVQEEQESVQTIEKVMNFRRGKRGAVGMQTYIYEVEKTGDPNSNFDPNDPSQIEDQYLIKWKGWSHLHNTWESMESLKTQKVKGLKKVENFIRKEDDLRALKSRLSPEELEYIEIQAELERDLHLSHLIADRIFAEAFENDDNFYYIKWRNLPYSEATWESEDLVLRKFSKQLEEYRRRENSSCFPKQCPVLKHRPKFAPLRMQPDFLGGDDANVELRDYQLDGLNWLIHSWCRHNSVILADEMGLGKTIQTISFLSYLFHVHHLYGPFLLVVPLSTMNAWQKEFSQWAPDMNVIVYIGDRDSRRIINEYEWTYNSKRIKFNAILTTNEILLRDKEVLQDSCQWAALVIDEAHRLKNEESQLYQALKEFKSNHRLLITGTPLQNSLKELWALLHFIMPDKFDDWAYFEQQHDGDNMKKGFHRLHHQLEPFLLRRVKKDVEKSLPSKVEQILRVDMMQLQKQYYKWILTKNYEMLKKGSRASTAGFVNIVMELKKCCNHASLIKLNDENSVFNNAELLQQLLRGSGKLLLLDKLLVRLNETGHRVLIFSQMVRMLDILAQYLELRRFPFQRLDGSISGDLRRQALEHFNAEGSSDFCFLLSTRAGGLGINLATADTVIIFDSDWNPQNDLQAQARAHRIGQKNQVNIYRLVTKNSIEETIIERAKQKMVLDHLVIQSMDTSGRTVFNKKISGTGSTPFNKEELNSILKFKAEELFKDDEENEEEPVCDIDEILRRAETRDEGPGSAGDELLSAFKVASFNLDEEKEVSRLEKLQLQDENNRDWDEIIPEKIRLEVAEEERQKEMAELYLPPRKRKPVNADDEGGTESPMKRKRRRGSDTSEYEEESDPEKPRRRGRPRMYLKDSVKGFTDAEVRRFFKIFKKFSNPMRRLSTIAEQADMREKSLVDLRRLGNKIIERCKEAIVEFEAKGGEKAYAAEVNGKGPGRPRRDRWASFKLSGVQINAKAFLATMDELEPLDKVVPHSPTERSSWVLPLKRVKDAHWDIPWGIQEDSRLLRGIFEYGMNSWEQVKGDPALNLGDKILLENDTKPQSKHLENRVQYLLKMVKKTQCYSGVKKVAKPKGKRAKESKGISKEIIDEVDDDSTEEEKPNTSVLPSSSSSLSDATHCKSNAKDAVKEEKVCDVKKEEAMSDGEKEEGEKEKLRVKRKKKKKEQKEKKSQGPVHITANGEPLPIDTSIELDPNHPQWAECKEKMRPMKKSLKALDNPNSAISPEEQVQHTRLCLVQIGDHIEKTLQQHQDHETRKEWKFLLWQFVSKFTEYDAKKLHKLYKKNKKSSDEASTGASSSQNCDEKKNKHKEQRQKEGRKDDKKERSHSEKRRHEDHLSSQGIHHQKHKKPHNGLQGERPRKYSNSETGDPSVVSQPRERERNFHRSWHGSNRDQASESRYPQDFDREREGGYHHHHRDNYNSFHRHRGGGGHHNPQRYGGSYGGPAFSHHGGHYYGSGGPIYPGGGPLPHHQMPYRGGSHHWNPSKRKGGGDRGDRWVVGGDGADDRGGSKSDWSHRDPRQERQPY